MRDVGCGTTLDAKAWDQEDLIGHALAKGRGVGGFGGADNGADIAESARAAARGADFADLIGNELGDGSATGQRLALNGIRAGVAGAHENEDAKGGVGEGLDGVRAHVAADGEGVSAAVLGGGGVVLCRDSDVASFDVEKDQEAGIARGAAAILEGGDPAGAEALEAGGLGLDDGDDGCDCVDDAKAEGADGGDGVVVGGTNFGGELIEDRVEAYARDGAEGVAAVGQKVGKMRHGRR